MTAYCYKSEHETSEALCQAEKEIKAQKIKEAMYKIVHVFKNACQVSVQESASFCLPELWLRKLSPSVFICKHQQT